MQVFFVDGAQLCLFMSTIANQRWSIKDRLLVVTHFENLSLYWPFLPELVIQLEKPYSQ